MQSFRKAFRTPRKPNLDKIDPENTLGIERAEGEALLGKNREALSKLGYKLYAEGKRALLVVLQATDTAGKDGVIRHVMTGLNPQGVRVTAFKTPTPRELAHDFLWRVHAAAPAHGEIGVFNRSHYEDILIVRVRNLVPERDWKRRYDRIREFEALLTGSGTTIVKIFLHIDKDEQAKRLQARIDNPEKNWKFEMGDLAERKCWEAYTRAYEAALRKCDCDAAPWYIVPSNKKWFRNAAVSQIMVETLQGMKLKLPEPAPGLEKVKIS